MILAILLAFACGSERRPVKTLADAPRSRDPAGSTVTTISALRAVQPIVWHNKTPRVEAEKDLAGLAVWIVGYKTETDSDWHVVIRDAAGQTMIAEFVHPGFAASPIARSVFTRARRQFMALGVPAPTAKYRQLPQAIPVSIAGPVFLDHPHGQVGRALNDVELHPVTWVARRHGAAMSATARSELGRSR